MAECSIAQILYDGPGGIVPGMAACENEGIFGRGKRKMGRWLPIGWIYISAEHFASMFI